MPYTPTNWEDLPSVTTPITAAELNRIEAGVDAAVEFADTHPGAVDPHTQYQKESEKGQAGGYASLDGSGTVPAAQIPAIAITTYLGSVADQSAMLALSGQVGDWAIRSDLGQTAIITGADPTQLSSWTFLAYPAAPVVSVNSETGAVVLDATDVGAEPAGTVATHSADTTGVHGIADTSQIILEGDARLSDARTPTTHEHDDRYYTETETDTLLSGKSNTGHLHDDRYYTESETDTLLSNKADLVGGLVPSSQIPAIAVTEYLGAAVDQTAMLSLVGQKGDFCTRTDTGTNWVITGNDPTQLADWTQLSYPTAPVTSVNSQTGVVVLNAGDVGAAPVSHGSHNTTTYSTTPPVSPVVGDRWISDETGNEYVWLNDGTSTQWIMTDAGGSGGGGGSLTVQDENGNVATGVTQIDFQGGGLTATSGTGEVIVTSSGSTFDYAAASPPPSLGGDGDWTFYQAYNGTNNSAFLDGTLYKKSAGVWGATKASLAIRPPFADAGIVPGMQVIPTDAWLSSPPLGWYSSGAGLTGSFSLGSGVYSPTPGVAGSLTTTNGYSSQASNVGLTFFSVVARIDALPDAGRIARIGAIYCSGSSVYGYGIEIDSSGGYTLNSFDSFSGTRTLGTGGTGIVPGSIVLVERFGNRVFCARTAADSLVLTGQMEGVADYGTVAGYAGVFGKTAMGIQTNSSTVRISEVKFTC